MSRVTITELKRNTTAKVVDANATLDSFDSATADINGDNIAEEGLDRRPIKAGSVTPSRGRKTYSSDEVNPINASSFSVPRDLSGNLMVCGPVNYNRQNGDELVIRASAQYVTTISGLLLVRLAYSTDFDPSSGTGTWTKLQKSQRPFMNRTTTHASKGSWTVATRFTEGGDSFAESGLYFGIEVNTGGDSMELSYIRLFTTLHAK